MKNNKHTKKEDEGIMNELNNVFKKEFDKTFHKTEERVNFMEFKVRDYIRKNPERSVLIAAGIGAIIGSQILSFLKHK